MYPWELIHCLQYASTQGYGCQCLGFLTRTRALMHATARWGCRNTVRLRESALRVGWEKDPLLYGRLEPISAAHQIQCTAHWATSSRSLVTELWSEWKDFLSATFHMHPVPHHNTHHSQTLVILQLPTMPQATILMQFSCWSCELEMQVTASKTWNANYSQ